MPAQSQPYTGTVSAVSQDGRGFQVEESTDWFNFSKFYEGRAFVVGERIQIGVTPSGNGRWWVNEEQSGPDAPPLSPPSQPSPAPTSQVAPAPLRPTAYPDHPGHDVAPAPAQPPQEPAQGPPALSQAAAAAIGLSPLPAPGDRGYADISIPRQVALKAAVEFLPAEAMTSTVIEIAAEFYRFLTFAQPESENEPHEDAP